MSCFFYSMHLFQFRRIAFYAYNFWNVANDRECVHWEEKNNKMSIIHSVLIRQWNRSVLWIVCIFDNESFSRTFCAVLFIPSVDSSMKPMHRYTYGKWNIWFSSSFRRCTIKRVRGTCITQSKKDTHRRASYVQTSYSPKNPPQPYGSLRQNCARQPSTFRLVIFAENFNAYRFLCRNA